MNADAHRNQRIADAIEKCDWSGCPIGNKEILRAAIVALRSAAVDAAVVSATGKSTTIRHTKSGVRATNSPRMQLMSRGQL